MMVAGRLLFVLLGVLFLKALTLVGESQQCCVLRHTGVQLLASFSCRNSGAGASLCTLAAGSHVCANYAQPPIASSAAVVSVLEKPSVPTLRSCGFHCLDVHRVVRVLAICIKKALAFITLFKQVAESNEVGARAREAARHTPESAHGSGRSSNWPTTSAFGSSSPRYSQRGRKPPKSGAQIGPARQLQIALIACSKGAGIDMFGPCHRERHPDQPLDREIGSAGRAATTRLGKGSTTMHGGSSSSPCARLLLLHKVRQDTGALTD